MSTDSSQNNKRIAKNTLLLYVRMLFMMVIGLYTSRVILDKLGEVDFGIYNVVGGFVTMFTVISGAMASATQRFLSFEIGKGKDGNVKGIFSTMLYIHLFLALIVLVFGEIVGVWFLNNHMSFPADRYDAANWVFQLSLLVFILNVINVPYNGALIAYEEMSAFAYFSLFDAIFKLAICYVITLTPFDKLVVYAVLMAVIQIALLIMYFIYCRFKFKDCRITGKFNREYGKKVGSFVSWNLIGSLAGVAKEQGVNVVLNIFFGPAVNAARGIAYQVLGKLNGFVSNFQMAMNPQIIKNYASGELVSLYRLVFRGAKFSYLLLLTLSLPIVVEASLVLNLWLKDVPQFTVIFLQITIFTALINTLSNPLIITMHATGKVRDYQVVVGCLSLLTLPLVYITLKLGAAPYMAMVIAFLVELVCHFARLYMLVRSIDFPMVAFLRSVTLRMALITIISLVLPAFAHQTIAISSLRIIIVCILSLMSTIGFGYYLGFNKADRNILRTKVATIVKTKILKR